VSVLSLRRNGLFVVEASTSVKIHSPFDADTIPQYVLRAVSFGWNESNTSDLADRPRSGKFQRVSEGFCQLRRTWRICGLWLYARIRATAISAHQRLYPRSTITSSRLLRPQRLPRSSLVSHLTITIRRFPYPIGVSLTAWSVVEVSAAQRAPDLNS